ncbi:MAG: SRPBCC domain-containing protein [Candidatus Obscuribacter sp.]|nr:SRPBCC domain-containing protein [Candidatus Obscuribacter sp.]
MTRDPIVTIIIAMDAVFRALNDANRRRILDLLHECDGQTLVELEANFDQMTRFGVMKHLKILESASLVTTRKSGRFKYHYLNAVPLQEISDRWISRFAAPWSAALADLKNDLEMPKDNGKEMENQVVKTKPQHVFVTVIKTTPEKLWSALTDGKITPAYYYGATFDGEIRKGAQYSYIGPDGNSFVSGEILEAIKPEKLVMTFKGEWMPGMQDDKPSRVTYEILQQGDCCRLTLIHDQFEAETQTFKNTGGGWPGIISGLKTLLETGQPLNYNPMGG